MVLMGLMGLLSVAKSSTERCVLLSTLEPRDREAGGTFHSSHQLLIT
jgi:hypothetical protein